jgi:hypothetical protein
MRSAVAMLSLSRIGMPCSGPRTPGRLALGVERVGDRERVGVQLEHAVQERHPSEETLRSELRGGSLFNGI